MGYHCWACKRPFDADSGPDPDTVWYATGTVDSGPTNVYHTDRDCYRLDRADEVRTIAREDLAEPWTQCRTCAGRDEAGHGAYETLLEADPDEFGDPELVTDGGRATRVGHCRRDDIDVYIGRGNAGQDVTNSEPGEHGWLGNPFHVEDYGLEGCIERFRDVFETRLQEDEAFRRAVRRLAGQTLGCWCRRVDADGPACHGDVIAEWADRLDRQLVAEAGDVDRGDGVETDGGRDVCWSLDCEQPATETFVDFRGQEVAMCPDCYEQPCGRCHEPYEGDENRTKGLCQDCRDEIASWSDDTDDRDDAAQTTLVTDGGQPLEDLGRDELVERVEALRNDVEALTAERVTLRTRAQRMALGARVVAIVASGLGAAVTAYLVSVYGTAAWRAALLATGLVVVAWGLSIGVRVGVATLREGSA
jgi:uncharacterized small protein (DUF1192 family)